MPQLDLFTYFPQFLWLSIFLITFYVLVYYDGLPKISTILKIRSQSIGLKNLKHIEESNNIYTGTNTINSLQLAMLRPSLEKSLYLWIDACKKQNSKKLSSILERCSQQLCSIQASNAIKQLAIEQKTISTNFKLPFFFNLVYSLRKKNSRKLQTKGRKKIKSNV